MNEAQQLSALDRARRGDRAALNALLDRYKVRVRALISKRDGKPATADAIAAALSELRKAFPHFQDAGLTAFAAWVRGRVLGQDGPTLRVRPGEPPAPSAHTPAGGDSWATLGGGDPSAP